MLNQNSIARRRQDGGQLMPHPIAEDACCGDVVGKVWASVSVGKEVLGGASQQLRRCAGDTKPACVSSAISLPHWKAAVEAVEGLR